MFVCVCSAVTDHQIIDAIDDGVCNFQDLQEKLGVAKTCGTCSCEVKKMLQTKVEQTLSRQSAQPLIVPAYTATHQ